jgi:hypothetical protein
MTTIAMTVWRHVLLSGCVCAAIGSAAWADSYAYLGTADKNFGVVDLTTGGYSLCGTSSALLAGLAEDSAGNVYGGGFQGNAFYSVNPANGALTLIAYAGFAYWGTGSTTHGVYALDGSFNLYSVDTATGATKLIGSTGLAPGKYWGMSTGSGKLYLENDGTLYSLNTGSGKAKLIGSGSNEIGGLVYTGGELYGGSVSDPPVVWLINRTNGSQTEVSTIENEANSTFGLAPAPKHSKGTCPN